MGGKPPCLHFRHGKIEGRPKTIPIKFLSSTIFISWAKAPALYVTISQVVVEVVEKVHFLDLAFRAQIKLRNVKVKVTLR